MSGSGASYPLLLVFVDGVGLASASAGNPLSSLPTPALRRLLGGPLCLEARGERDGLVLAALDATLGVDGLPQSVTGQATLFTGVNCARLLGRHVTGFVGDRIATVVQERSLLRQLSDAGREVTFANAYARRRPGALARRNRSVTTLATQAAGLPLRGVEELLRDEAVTWDIERDRFARLSDRDVPPVEAATAGRHLAEVAAAHDFTLFETFITDLAAHGRFDLAVDDAVRRLDGLIEGVLGAADGRFTLVLTSDHGNLEDSSTRLHTRNPVPFLAAGPAASHFRGLASLAEVTPRIVDWLAGTAGSVSS